MDEHLETTRLKDDGGRLLMGTMRSERLSYLATRQLFVVPAYFP